MTIACQAFCVCTATSHLVARGAGIREYLLAGIASSGCGRDGARPSAEALEANEDGGGAAGGAEASNQRGPASSAITPTIAAPIGVVPTNAVDQSTVIRPRNSGAAAS